MSEVEVWRVQCDPELLPSIDALRAIALQAEPRLVENIKWNAPNFSFGGEDRITLGSNRKGGARVVLHRGASRIDDRFAFDDTDGLARWPSPDRGVIEYADIAQIHRDRDRLVDLFRRWLKAVA